MSIAFRFSVATPVLPAVSVRLAATTTTSLPVNAPLLAVYTPSATVNFAEICSAVSATPSTAIVTVADPSADVTWKPASYNPFWVSSTRTRLTTGTTVSIVITTAPEAALVLPAASVCVAVMLCVPCAVRLTVADHAPLALAVVVPTTVLPSSTVTAAPASAVPPIVCVVLLLVTAVVLITGTPAAVVSIAFRFSVAVPALPAASV